MDRSQDPQRSVFKRAFVNTIMSFPRIIRACRRSSDHDSKVENEAKMAHVLSNFVQNGASVSMRRRLPNTPPPGRTGRSTSTSHLLFGEASPILIANSATI